MVVWVLLQRVLFCRKVNRGSSYAMAGSVRLEHTPRGDDVCLKLLQGHPCASRSRYLVLLVLELTHSSTAGEAKHSMCRIDYLCTYRDVAMAGSEAP